MKIQFTINACDFNVFRDGERVPLAIGPGPDSVTVIIEADINAVAVEEGMDKEILHVRRIAS